MLTMSSKGRSRSGSGGRGRGILALVVVLILLPGASWSAPSSAAETAFTVGVSGGGPGPGSDSEADSEGEGVEYLLELVQRDFLLDFCAGELGFTGITIGLKPALPPVRLLETDLFPYMMVGLGRGGALGLYGQFTRVTVLALYRGLGDLALSVGGARFFLRGEYAVGNISLRGHLQLEWGELATPTWPEKTEELYFPEWELVTLGGRRLGYLPSSNFYMEIRRRFTEELTLSEGFTMPFGDGRLAPGLLLNIEGKSLAVRLLNQFPQAGLPGYTLLSVGLRGGLILSEEQPRAILLGLDLNFRWFTSGGGTEARAKEGEIDLSASLEAGDLLILGEVHLKGGGATWGLRLRWSLPS